MPQFGTNEAYDLLVEYLEEFPETASWSEETSLEFWRMFIDGNQQAAGSMQFCLGARFYSDFDELSTLTADKLRSIPELLPVLSKMNPEENLGEALYRLKLNGLAPFEGRESNYLRGMLEGYHFLSQQQGKINTNLLKKLHENTLNKVTKTLCETSEKGHFREEDAYFCVYPTRQTQLGIEHYLTTLQNGETAFEIFITDKARTRMQERIAYHREGKFLAWKSVNFEEDYQKIFNQFQIDLQAQTNPLAIDLLNNTPLYAPKNFKQEMGELLDKEVDFEIVARNENNNIIRRYKFHSSEQGPVLQCVVYNQTEEPAEILTAVHRFMDAVEKKENRDSFCTLRSPAPLNSEAMENRIQHEIDTYYQKLEYCQRHFQDKNQLRYHQLLETVTFIQILCRIHPFKDGNTRTFVMLLLPHLLNMLGFGKICIFEDPNRFWLFSPEELVKEVIQALRNGQDLAAGEESLLSEFLDTESMIAAFSPDQKRYFDACHEQYKRISALDGTFVASESMNQVEKLELKPGGFFPKLSKKRSHSSDEENLSNKKLKLAQPNY